MAIHPVQIQNTFLRHAVFWCVFLPFLSLIFLPLLIEDQNIDQNEIVMIGKLGINVEMATERTNALYSSMFISTGILHTTEKFFSGNIIPNQGHDLEKVVEATSFSAKWIRGFWLLLYKCIWRLNMLISIFFIPTIIVCIPSAVDGFATRARKQFRFERANPVYFYSSMHLAVFIVGLFVYLPLLPIALTANLLALFIFSLSAAVWIASSNFQTGR